MLPTFFLSGLSMLSKFTAILTDMLLVKQISILGLQQTHSAASALTPRFKNFLTSHDLPNLLYTSFWDYDPRDSHSGVGFIVARHIHRYVHQIHKFKGRLIALDLHFSSTKFCIINIYNYHRMNWKNSTLLVDGIAFANYIIDYITSSNLMDSKSLFWAILMQMQKSFLFILLQGLYSPTL